MIKFSKKTKQKLGLVALFIAFGASIISLIMAFADFYTINYGQPIEAIVIDNSEVCRYKNQKITLLVNNKRKTISLFGYKCRSEEFTVNKTITVYQSNIINTIAIPKNGQVARIIIFPLLTTLLFFLIKRQVKRYSGSKKNE